MPKDVVSIDQIAQTFQDRSLFHEAQMAFLEEIEARGGSLIATSLALSLTSADLARRAGALELLSFWQAADYDAARKSNHNLPSFIALDECLTAMRDRHGCFGQDHNMLFLKAGIAKFSREETWSMDAFTAFLKAGEDLFAAARDTTGVTTIFAPIGLDALDRTAERILMDNPRLRAQLQAPGEEVFDRYFDHLSLCDIEQGHIDIITISRAENRSPAWISGKVIALGMMPLHHPVLDPILDPGQRHETAVAMDSSALTILRRYHEALTRRAHQDRSLDEASRHSLRLHLAVAAAGLRQVNELDATPARLMAIADHLDRGLREIGRRSDGLQAYAMAAQMRLHVSARAEKLLATHTGRH